MNLVHLSWARIPDLLLLSYASFDLIIDLYFGVWLKGSNLSWRPPRVHFADSLLHFEPKINLFSLVQLDNRNTNLFFLVNFRFKSHRHDRFFVKFHIILINRIHRFDILGGHFAYTLIFVSAEALVMDLEPELNFACLAIITIFRLAFAFPGVLIFINSLAIERNEPDSLGQKFIMQYRSILVHGNQMRSHCRHFCNKSSTQGVS